MIQINKKDSIIDVIKKIQNNNCKEIILEFPFNHTILCNYIFLKILKEKCEKKRINNYNK